MMSKDRVCPTCNGKIRYFNHIKTRCVTIHCKTCNRTGAGKDVESAWTKFSMTNERLADIAEATNPPQEWFDHKQEKPW